MSTPSQSSRAVPAFRGNGGRTVAMEPGSPAIRTCGRMWRTGDRCAAYSIKGKQHEGFDRGRGGNMHGHTWEVTAWWAGKPDALTKQATLTEYLAFFDHSILADSLAWAEDMAQRIMEDLGCVKVEISRPLERLYAIAPTPDQTNEVTHG